MKWIIFYILFFALVSCSKNDNYVKKIAPVNIYSVSIPPKSGLSEPVQIKTFAREGNGCWKDFYFKFTKEKDFHYSITAYATFESRGACSAVMVGKDTVFTFTPGKTGQYIFKTNDLNSALRTDTLTVY